MIIASGKVNKYSYIIMELLGKNLTCLKRSVKIKNLAIQRHTRSLFRLVDYCFFSLDLSISFGTSYRLIAIRCTMKELSRLLQFKSLLFALKF